MSLGNDLARNNNARCLDQLVLLTSHYVSVLNNNNCRNYLRLNNHGCSSKQRIRLNLVTMFTPKKGLPHHQKIVRVWFITTDWFYNFMLIIQSCFVWKNLNQICFVVWGGYLNVELLRNVSVRKWGWIYFSR